MDAIDIIRTQEHLYLPIEKHPDEWCEKLMEYEGLCLNPAAEPSDKKYFLTFTNGGDGWGYYTSYIIGAQWLDARKQKALVVTPKEAFKHIDFMQLFASCLKVGIESEGFSKIYGIYMDEKRVDAPELESVLSPLLVVHYITLLQKLLHKGLKKGYVHHQENLKKVKGRIHVSMNEKHNILGKRYDKVYCDFQEFSVDIPENRLLKKALRFSISILSRKGIKAHADEIRLLANRCMSSFNGVDDSYSPYALSHFQQNSLFKEYEEALRVAGLILRNCDYSIHEAGNPVRSVPPFWIDMSLLFEHYVLGLLKASYDKKVIYQVKGTWRERPDFLLKNNEEKLILDTKYMDNVEKIEIVRQLSGYARDEKILNALDAHCVDDRYDEIIPCVFIRPVVGDAITCSFNGVGTLLSKCTPIAGFAHFYQLAIPMPLVSLSVLHP